MKDEDNLLRVLTGIFASLVVALITGFGINLQSTIKAVEHENYLQGQQLIEVKEKLILIRDRQVENEGKIDRNRSMIEELKLKLIK